MTSPPFARECRLNERRNNSGIGSFSSTEEWERLAGWSRYTFAEESSSCGVFVIQPS